MREDSPVLAALKGVTAECRRPGCTNTYSPIDPYERFTPHRCFGYCSKLCHQKAIEEYKRTHQKEVE